ncbi:glycosyltransferase [Sphingomonas sp. URHD0057]|uniref:glycosyltransferase n=1 Tax=Sphingomonas sp. URHD0057 TaxID=1380389 RepID=UPI0009DD4D6D|nr:glycosyltransferase [Sphingomonas sp. URHD0057]
MRIVDVSAFYSPAGGGVRTYVEAKLRAAPRFGHEMIVVVPGRDNAVERRGPGAYLVSLASPTLPVDRRYRYFDDQQALHRTLAAWRPDHVEASSPWSSATMVGRWQGAASRSLVMHADPMAAYAYRWLGGVVRIETIDRWFGAFWRHLRGLGQMFDAVICANGQLAGRLRAAGIGNARTIAMGVEPERFSPALRSSALRADALRSLGLDSDATLLAGIGRFSGEKRWEMVVRAVDVCSRQRPVGMLLIGDGPRRARLEIMVARMDRVAVLPRLDNRAELARMVASADALIHGCEAETFCLVAAEARASGIPMIVPDRGAALDLLAPHAGHAFRAGSERSLQRAIGRFIDGGVELQRAAAVRASGVRTIDQHFAELFALYAQVASMPVFSPMPILAGADSGVIPELAVARSSVRHS